MSGMRHLSMALLVLGTSASGAAAQAVSGVVVDEQSRTAVAGAEVELLPERQRDGALARTDSTGRFVLAAPRAGTYRLQVRHAAYVTYQVDSVTIGIGEVVSLEIRMGREAVPIEPLVVTARRTAMYMTGFEDRRRMGFGRFLTREDFDVHASTRVTDLLRNLQGLSFRSAGGAGSMIYMRGGTGLCQPAIWLDGVQVRQYPGNTMDDILTPDIIEAVEMYTSVASAPTQYVSGPCGVLMLWTRRGSGAGGQPWQWKKLLLGLGAAAGLLLLIR